MSPNLERFLKSGAVIILTALLSVILIFKRDTLIIEKPETEHGVSRNHNNFIKTVSTLDFVPLSTTSGTAANPKPTVESINHFNKIHLNPRLESIVMHDYFRYVKLDLFRPCSLWPDDGKCSLRDCTVKTCDDGSCPTTILELSGVNETVPEPQVQTMNNLFECDEHERSDGGHYIDLTYNPERFTGYSGESAHRIWRAIYEENCFLATPHSHSNDGTKGGGDFRGVVKNQKGHQHRSIASRRSDSGLVPTLSFSPDNLCYEERMFWRAISGLHTSINIHLCASYLDPASGEFTHNLNEFVRRFRGQDQYLKNLYFVYLLELRALQKAEPYLLSRVAWYSSGDLAETRDAIRDLLKSVRRAGVTFDERELFRDQRPAVAREFSDHFRNITSHLMDCVGCQKCKLWGKVQLHGLGTAFKILLTVPDNPMTGSSAGGGKSDQIFGPQFKLSRYEITTLVNALARLSNSISQLEYFSALLDTTSESGAAQATGPKPSSDKENNKLPINDKKAGAKPGRIPGVFKGL